MVPACTASSTWNPGTISPAGKQRIWNLLSVSSATRLAMFSAPPKMMSMLRGKLLVRRQRISGFWVCAMAGAASAAGVAAAAAVPRTRRRCMDVLPMLLGRG